MSPLSKVQREQLFPKHSQAYVLYANIDFRAKRRSLELHRLLDLLKWSGPDWPEAKTIRFFEEHQRAFRDCLEWLLSGAVVDLRDDLWSGGDDEYLLGEWKRDKNVAFLQLHGLDHAGVALRAADSDIHAGTFYGLRLDQGWARDPLDPICWHLIEILSGGRTLGVQRCGYARCGKFFVPPTARKRFCKDSCRALQHQLTHTLDKHDEQEFRKRRREYMRRHRANPMVKRRISKRKK